jgi:hypothetical protein
VNGASVFRLGVFGSLSLINSAIANRLRIYGVAANPRKASGVFSKCSQPRRAAQLTAAGGVMERSPATTPMRNASKYSGIGTYYITGGVRRVAVKP